MREVPAAANQGCVIAGAIVSMFLGKDLKDDPEYQARLKAGLIPAPKAPAVAASRPLVTAGREAMAHSAAALQVSGGGAAVMGGPGFSAAGTPTNAGPTGVHAGESRAPLKSSAKPAAFIFLAGVALVVLFGFFPSIRTLPGAKGPLAMPLVIEIVMMSVAAIMLLVTRVAVDEVPKTATLRAGVVAVIGIFGLAWLGDSFIAANKDVIVPAIGKLTEAAPWTFAFGLFFASVLLYSQAATTRALMPLGLALGIPPQFLVAMFPSVNGCFFVPTYGSLIAAINFDLSGTTKIGKYVLNHSFMVPGLVATSVTVITGLFLASMMF